MGISTLHKKDVYIALYLCTVMSGSVGGGGEWGMY